MSSKFSSFLRPLSRIRPTPTTLRHRTMSTSNDPRLPSSSIPIFESVAAYRAWRNTAFAAGKSVGFVPTMGALHDGHLALVQKSLAENDLTVVSIFVNPAQFAPHEDLATYPRTLPRTLPSSKRNVPSGISQDPAAQKGAFVEVKGYGHQMEGRSRPTFFRGVATVVTKLFGAVQPTRAYFGQKDIQQALLLRRLCRDLLMAYPEPHNVSIVPTARDPHTGLALTRDRAGSIRALRKAEDAWARGASKGECIRAAEEQIGAAQEEARVRSLGVRVQLDYLDMNDAETFDALDPNARVATAGSRGILLSGALCVDNTRLIDNIILVI
ncbi:pantothenate synthetase [Infundibulicybe gibba]|nr:pantothenate synthetase [Infundibulicybe gibba]